MNFDLTQTIGGSNNNTSSRILWLAAGIFYAALRLLPSPSKIHPTLLLLVLFAFVLGTFCITPISEWLLLIVFFVPFEFSRAVGRLPSLSPNDYFIGALLLAFLVKMSWNRIPQHIEQSFGIPGIVCWASFFVYSILAAHFLHGDLRHPLRWAAFLICFFVSAEAGRQNDDRLMGVELPCLLAWLGGMIGLLAFVQFVGSHGHYAFVTATFQQHNPVGMFLSLCLPASLFWSQQTTGNSRRFRVGLLMAAFVGFLISYSRGAWLGLVVGMLVVFRLKHLPLSKPLFRWTLVVFAIGVVAILVRQPRIRTDGRELHFLAAKSVLKAHPWAGLGPGNYPSQIKNYLSGQSLTLYKDDMDTLKRPNFWLHLHNFYLQILVEYGVIGASFLFFGLFLLVLKAFQNRDNSTMQAAYLISILAFAIHSCFDLLTINSFDYLLAMFLGLSAANSGPPKDNKTSHPYGLK